MEKRELGRSYQCGIGPCWLKSLQRFATMPLFGGFFCAYAVVYGIQVVYLYAVITNIEKAFGYTSKESGTIASCIEIGYFLTILLLGYFGHRMNRSMVLGMGGVLVGIAGFVMTLPHFLFYTSINYENDYVNSNSDNLLCTKNDSVCDTEIYTSADGQKARILFIIAMILTGIGITPVWTVGMAFLDDNAPPGRSSVYVGLMFSARTLAPVFGYLVGSATVSFHIDLKDSSETGLEATDRNFTGAWWLGYFFTAPLVILISIPLILFPKKLRKYDEGGEMADTIQLHDADQRHEITAKLSTLINEIKGLIKCLLRIFKNAPFMFFAISLCFQIGPTYGYSIFLPKYLEQQFKVTSTTANMLTAIVFAFSPAIGLALSGIITSRLILKYKMKIWRMCLYTTYMIIALCLVFALFFLFGCDSENIVGVNIESNELSLDNKCNIDCHCSLSKFEPLCGEDGNTYFSACYAGCSSKLTRAYSNCSCLENGSTDAALGTCSSTCSMVVIFSVFTFVIGFIESLTSLPWTLFSFRILEPRDKSMGMAIIGLGITLFFVFIPQIYGYVIDESCGIERKGESCSADKSTCLIYDQYKFRINLHAITFGLRLGYPLFLVLSLWTSRNKVLYGDEDEETFTVSSAPKRARKVKVEIEGKEKVNGKKSPISKAKRNLRTIEEENCQEDNGSKLDGSDSADEEEIAV